MRLTHIFSLKPEAIAMGKNPFRDGLAKRLVRIILCQFSEGLCEQTIVACMP